MRYPQAAKGLAIMKQYSESTCYEFGVSTLEKDLIYESTLSSVIMRSLVVLVIIQLFQMFASVQILFITKVQTCADILYQAIPHK